MTLQAPRRTAPDDEMDERGEESPLLICTFAAVSASLEPMLLASSKSEAGTRIILEDLSCGEVVEDVVAVLLAPGTESADDVCAVGEEEEPEDT